MNYCQALGSLDEQTQELFLLACAKHAVDRLASRWNDPGGTLAASKLRECILRIRSPYEGGTGSPLLMEMEDWWTRDEEESTLPGLSEVLLAVMSVSYARAKKDYPTTIYSGVFHAYNAISELFLKETLPDGFATLGTTMDAMEMRIPECVEELEFQTTLLQRVAAGEDIDWDGLLS